MSRMITIAGVLAAIVALAFLSAPWFALRGLQAAARDGDVSALAELIDYQQVRTGLRAQLRPAATAPAPKLWEDPLGALSRAMKDTTERPPDVDRHLTASGLHALVGEPQLFPALRHWGPSRVRFAVGPQKATLLTFQRRGFVQWRLVQLRVPRSQASAG